MDVFNATAGFRQELGKASANNEITATVGGSVFVANQMTPCYASGNYVMYVGGPVNEEDQKALAGSLVDQVAGKLSISADRAATQGYTLERVDGTDLFAYNLDFVLVFSTTSELEQCDAVSIAAALAQLDDVTASVGGYSVSSQQSKVALAPGQASTAAASESSSGGPLIGVIGAIAAGAAVLLACVVWMVLQKKQNDNEMALHRASLQYDSANSAGKRLPGMENVSADVGLGEWWDSGAAPHTGTGAKESTRSRATSGFQNSHYYPGMVPHDEGAVVRSAPAHSDGGTAPPAKVDTDGNTRAVWGTSEVGSVLPQAAALLDAAAALALQPLPRPDSDSLDEGEGVERGDQHVAIHGKGNAAAFDIDLADPEVNASATKIQAQFRGHQARKEAAEQNAAAIKIQAQFRGHQARKNTDVGATFLDGDDNELQPVAGNAEGFGGSGDAKEVVGVGRREPTPVVSKGDCAYCGRPVTSAQARRKDARGAYRHAACGPASPTPATFAAPGTIPANTGVVSRAGGRSVGMTVEDAPSPDAGVIISGVEEGGQAATLGFTQGQQILLLNDADVRGYDRTQFAQLMVASETLKMQVDSPVVPP